jgi:hypothetical protein
MFCRRLDIPLLATRHPAPARVRPAFIEDIVPGDRVWAWKPQQRGWAPCRVKQLFRRPAQPVVRVTCRDHAGDEDHITATREHPFWVAGQGWTPACRLQPGDILQTLHDRAFVQVVRVQDDDDTRLDVYNFEVDEAHNFFVGRRGVLVHNESRPPAPDAPAPSAPAEPPPVPSKLAVGLAAGGAVVASVAGFVGLNSVLAPGVLLGAPNNGIFFTRFATGSVRGALEAKGAHLAQRFANTAPLGLAVRGINFATLVANNAVFLDTLYNRVPQAIAPSTWASPLEGAGHIATSAAAAGLGVASLLGAVSNAGDAVLGLRGHPTTAHPWVGNLGKASFVALTYSIAPWFVQNTLHAMTTGGSMARAVGTGAVQAIAASASFLVAREAAANHAASLRGRPSPYPKASPASAALYLSMVMTGHFAYQLLNPAPPAPPAPRPVPAQVSTPRP